MTTVTLLTGQGRPALQPHFQGGPHHHAEARPVGSHGRGQQKSSWHPGPLLASEQDQEQGSVVTTYAVSDIFL